MPLIGRNIIIKEVKFYRSLRPFINSELLFILYSILVNSTHKRNCKCCTKLAGDKALQRMQGLLDLCLNKELLLRIMILYMLTVILLGFIVTSQYEVHVSYYM